MYVMEQYKEGILTKTDGTVLVKIRCRIASTDETIYNSLKKIAPLIEYHNPQYRINTVFKNVLDEKPSEEIDRPSEDVSYEDTTLTVPKHTYIIKNVVWLDEDVYGDNYDGVNRRIRILWVDEQDQEHFVPMIGIDDESQAVNPHGAYEYNSETKELSFSQIRPYSTEYIVRRYNYATT